MCRSGGAELEASRDQITVCAMIIALLGVASSFAVAFGHGVTAAREYPPSLSPETLTHHMCACRSRTFERTVPQAELSDITRKAKRNRSIKT